MKELSTQLSKTQQELQQSENRLLAQTNESADKAPELPGLQAINADLEVKLLILKLSPILPSHNWHSLHVSDANAHLN